jgi:hypothetical protein
MCIELASLPTPGLRRYSSYVTEKLVDCLLTATVPIYWGPDDGLPAGLDTDGIIFIRDLEHGLQGAAWPFAPALIGLEIGFSVQLSRFLQRAEDAVQSKISYPLHIEHETMMINGVLTWLHSKIFEFAVLDSLSGALYESMLPAVVHNFHLAKVQSSTAYGHQLVFEAAPRHALYFISCPSSTPWRNPYCFTQAERGQGLLDPLGWVWDYGLSDILKHRSSTECRGTCPSHAVSSEKISSANCSESLFEDNDSKELLKSAAISSGQLVKIIVGVNENLYKNGDREFFDGGMKEDVRRTLEVSWWGSFLPGSSAHNLARLVCFSDRHSFTQNEALTNRIDLKGVWLHSHPSFTHIVFLRRVCSLRSSQAR